MKSIPDILEKSDIEKALNLLLPDLVSISSGKNKSTVYDLLWNGYRFPPKLVISQAIELKTNQPFPVEEFSGGNATGQANYVLSNLGYTIVRKDDLSDVALPLELHERYGRKEAFALFNIEYDTRLTRNLNKGMSPRLSDGGYFVFVTLNKDNYDESYDYDDRIYLDTFFTTTRRDRSDSHPDYINLRNPETRISLFVRNNKNEVKFLYAGELSYSSHEQFREEKRGKIQQSYVFKLKNPLTEKLLEELTFGIVSNTPKRNTANPDTKSQTRKPSNFDEFKKAFSYVLGEVSARTVIPAHHNYQVELKNYLENKNITARFEENFIDVQFENEGDNYIGEIKVTTNISTSQAFRAALGQVLEYAHLKFDEKPKMIMFLDSQLDEQRLNLASSLSIAVVIKQDQNFRILNPETFENLSLIFET